MKNKIFYFIIPILFCALLSSNCNKLGPNAGTVSGTVKDITTNEAIPGAFVYLLAHEKDGSIIGGSPSFVIDSATADANGNFSFVLEENPDWGYTCTAVKDLYFNYFEEYTADGDYETGLYADVFLYPKAWLQLRCVNVSPCDDTDELTLSMLFGSEYPEFNGMYVDTTICCFLLTGNIVNVITTYVDKCGSSLNTDYEVTINSFDTLYYEIYY